MKSIINYIFEKFKISKDINSSSDMYSIGTKCLYICIIPKNINHPYDSAFLSIDVVEIVKINKTSVTCIYKTHICADKYTHNIYFKQNNYSGYDEYYFWTTMFNSRKKGVLIPDKYCKDIIDKLEEKPYLSFTNLIDNKNDEHTGTFLVAERIPSKDWGSPLVYSNIRRISSNNIDKIKNQLLNI